MKRSVNLGRIIGVVTAAVLTIGLQLHAQPSQALEMVSFPVTFPDIVPQLPNNLRCLNEHDQAMPYNNEQVLQWRTSTPNSFHARGFIQGKVVQVYANKGNGKNSHTHFAVNIDARAGGDIEIIFNDEFGPLPTLPVGSQVVACGDYITANSESRLPSPMGAIIHWVHYNPGNRDGGVHEDGFVIVNGKPYGFNAPAGNSPYIQRDF